MERPDFPCPHGGGCTRDDCGQTWCAIDLSWQDRYDAIQAELDLRTDAGNAMRTLLSEVSWLDPSDAARVAQATEFWDTALR